MIRVVRKSKIDQGRVLMTIYVNNYALVFDIEGNLALNWIYKKEAMFPVFPELTPEQVVECFGPLPLAEEACIVTNEFGAGEEISVPATRTAVKRQSRLIEEWIKNGVNNCKYLVEQKGIKNWLWERAVAKYPDYRFRPGEKMQEDE